MDTAALLCERCGYTIDHLPTTSQCPECGDAIARSLPETRPGSPFQQRPRLLSWWTTNWQALRHPRTLFRRLAIEPRSATRLLLANLFITSILIMDPIVSVWIGDPARTFRHAPAVISGAVYAASWTAQVTACALVLLTLTRLEWLGIRFVANRRGWRLSKDAAWQVCCHASVGWIFVGLAPLLGMAWMYIFSHYFGMAPRGMLDFPPFTSRPIPWTYVANFGLIALGLLGGLLVFETLVYVGVRQCRYANRSPHPQPTQGPTVAAVTPDAQRAHSPEHCG
jgi:predicted RNA-binding Zn-ribbon protein involved in translation (DUF1610 family)